MKPKLPVTLTAHDWVEIAAALSSKHAAVKVGYYGRDGAADTRWIAHLEAIMLAIGPDGENAAALGVMPVEGFAPGPCIHGDYQTCEHCEGENHG